MLAFDGTSLASVATFAHGATINSVNWSPDGRFLAIGGFIAGGIEVQVLAFDGTSLTSVATFAHGAEVRSVNWSPNGTVLGIGGDPSGGVDVRVLSGLQFPQNCIIMENNVWGVRGPALEAGLPGVSNGRGISASSGANLIIKNTAFNNDINYIFVTDVYRQFLVNVASTVPSLIDNLSFPPL